MPPAQNRVCRCGGGERQRHGRAWPRIAFPYDVWPKRILGIVLKTTAAARIGTGLRSGGRPWSGAYFPQDAVLTRSAEMHRTHGRRGGPAPYGGGGGRPHGQLPVAVGCPPRVRPPVRPGGWRTDRQTRVFIWCSYCILKFAMRSKSGYFYTLVPYGEKLSTHTRRLFAIAGAESAIGRTHGWVRSRSSMQGYISTMEQAMQAVQAGDYRSGYRPRGAAWGATAARGRMEMRWVGVFGWCMGQDLGVDE